MRDEVKVFFATAVSVMFLLTPLTIVISPSAPSFSTALSRLGPSSGAARVGLPTSTDPQPFAFVSNFENKLLDGWSSVHGSAPKVVLSPNYAGEPSLKSSAKGGVQIDYAHKGINRDQSSVSLQVAIDAGATGIGYFGLGTAAHAFVAVVGVRNGSVVAGSNPSHLKKIEPVPKNSAQPAGWVYIIANVAIEAQGSSMQVFVDRTDIVAATEKVPGAKNYSGALIETANGTVHYSDIIVSTYQMGTLIPGYNNMEGYGEGSALLVSVLPAFDNYTATMTLKSWVVPQSGILSFQINAMNLTGTLDSTCDGFFQLGLSLDAGGQISPWYVPGVNCEAVSLISGAGVSTPPDSELVLTILLETKSQQILFSIKDTTIGVTWSADIAYSGEPFYGAYTQMEFQPCCNSFPIGAYALHGELSTMQITTMGGAVQSLPASYMLPFNLDAPPSWELGYYQNSSAAYNETAM